MKKKYICLGVVIILAIVVGAACLIGGTGTNSDTNTPYQLHIKYDGKWSGNYGGMLNGEYTSKSIDGNGEQTINIATDDYSSAVIQKMDSGSGELTVEILKDGQIVKNQSTSAEYGVVSL